MPIAVEREPEGMTRSFRGLMETCCFCRRPTPFWHMPSDVAVCEECAATHDASDVPVKEEWCRAIADFKPSPRSPAR